MKVAVNATFLTEKPTGLGCFTREVSRRIARLSNEGVIFSPLPVAGVSQDSLCKVPSLIQGSLSFRNNVLRALYINTVLPLRCRQRGVEVLFCPMLEFPFFSFVPLVVHVHDLHPLQFPTQYKRAAHYFRFSLGRIEKCVKRVTVSSAFVKSELLRATQLQEDSIDVVPLAYDSGVFHPRRVEGKKDFCDRYGIKERYILFVGNLFGYKNVKTLIRAFQNIREKIGHCLVIVGRKELASEQLPADSRILYTDYVPDEDLAKFYSYADMLVHPSLSEGFGLTPLEAMACGTPVISSSSSSLPEVIGDAGLLFDPRDSEALSRLILTVISNRTFRNELIEKGFRNIRRFSWDTTARGILQSCERALRR